MAVAHDAVSESHTGTTGNANSTSFTWNHVPTGTPRSALVFIKSSSTSPVTSVTYGGASMTQVPYTAYDSDTEPGYVEAWFLDNVASGTQAVVVNRTNNAVNVYATCMTQTASKATEVYLAGVKTIAASGAEQTAASSSGTGVSSSWSSMTLDDGSPGTNSIRYMAVHSGASSISAAGTNTTQNGASAEIDYGLYVFSTYRETTPSQGAKTLNIATAISDDLAVIGLAVREVPVDNRNYNAVLTGGGVLTSVRVKGGAAAATLTGGGVYTHDYTRSAKAANYSATLTGGGVANISARKEAVRAQALTGGGVLTASTRKGAVRAEAVTGGGVVALSDLKGGQTSAVVTGGGVANIAIRHGSVVNVAVTGGGILSVQAQHGSSGSVVATGGGIAIIDAVKGGGQAKAAEYTANLTGGGVVTLAVQAGRESSPALTGGGTAVLGTSGAHTASVTITGGGVFTLTYTTEGAEAKAEVTVVPVDMMQQGAGPVEKRRGRTPFDDWTLEMDDESVLEIYLMRKTR